MESEEAYFKFNCMQDGVLPAMARWGNHNINITLPLNDFIPFASLVAKARTLLSSNVF